MIQNLIEKFDEIRINIGRSHNAPAPMIWKSAGSDIGLCGLDLPENVGGKNLPAKDMIEIYKYFGNLGLHLRDVPGSGHARILIHQNSNKHDNFLKSVACGDSYAGLAITEELAGSNPKEMRTTAEACGTHYKLNGRKKYNARIFEADHFIVFAHVVDNNGARKPSVFLVPMKKEGIKPYRITGMGHNTMSWGGIEFHDCIISEDSLIGEIGEAPTLFAKHFMYWRLMIGATAIGCAANALEQATNRSKNRTIDSNPIGCFSHIQQDLAKHTARIRMAWLLCVDIAGLLDCDKATVADAAMTKAECVEASIEAVDWALRIHGAYGYSDECDLYKRYLDLIGLRIADGTTDVLRGQVAKSILGSRFGEDCDATKSQRKLKFLDRR